MGTTERAVLIIDDDETTLRDLSKLLAQRGLHVETATTASVAVQKARSRPFDLLLVDLRLPDMSGIQLIRTLRAEGVDTAFLVFTGFATIEVTVEAMRLGAVSVLEKPLVGDALTDAVLAAIQSHPTSTKSRLQEALSRLTRSARPMGSAVDRWALFVLKACQSEDDPRTLKAWSRLAGISYTSLRESCYLLNISPHDARDFTRVLRGILRSPTARLDPERVLDVSDRRTISVLIRRAGLDTHKEGANLLGQFFRDQSFITRSNPGVVLLSELLADDVSPENG